MKGWSPKTPASMTSTRLGCRIFCAKSGFPLKHPHHFLVFGETAMKNLEGNLPLQTKLATELGHEDFGHPARGQMPHHFVGPQRRPDEAFLAAAAISLRVVRCGAAFLAEVDLRAADASFEAALLADVESDDSTSPVGGVPLGMEAVFFLGGLRSHAVRIRARSAPAPKLPPRFNNSDASRKTEPTTSGAVES